MKTLETLHKALWCGVAAVCACVVALYLPAVIAIEAARGFFNF